MIVEASEDPLASCYNPKYAVGVAQLAEHRTVAPDVAGSIPVSHPSVSNDLIGFSRRHFLFPTGMSATVSHSSVASSKLTEVN